MGMALKADVTEACTKLGMQKPIDLVHLSRLTMGDRDLELELLKMFSGQICQYEDALNACTDEKQVKRAAHTIKGAARSIGAFRLAEIAQKAEETGLANRSEFRDEMSSVKRYISELV